MKKFLLIISLLTSASLFASSFEHIQKDCSYLNVSQSAISNLLLEWFNLDKHVSFVELRVVNDQIGMTHITLQQYVDEIPVKGGIILVHCLSNGLIKSINGEVLRVDATCLSQTESYGRKALSARYSTPANDQYPIVWVSYVKDGKNATRKAYKVSIAREYKTIYVDVTTGEVLKEESHINSLSGTAYTIYSGWRDIEYSNVNGENILFDSIRNISTFDASTFTINADNELIVNDFTNPNNNWAIQYLKSVTLSNANIEWWYNWLTDTKGDFYIKVKSMSGEVLYVSGFYRDKNPPITFTIPNDITIPVQNGLKIEIWDYDDISEGGTDDFGSSITLTAKTAGNYTWSNPNTTSGSCIVAERPHPALDVHWGMEKVWDYYLATFKHKGVDGNNERHIYNLVNPTPFLTEYGFPYNACAFSDENFGAGVFAYGYGDYGVYGSNLGISYMVAIDIIGHEFTHAVTFANGDQSLPNYGEGGALNESFGDIMGEAIEKYAKGSCDWLVGVEVTTNGKGLRSMKNPSNSSYKHPQTYLRSPYWKFATGSPTSENDMDGVHINCGVQNYWFYLLCEGGSGTNDYGSSYNITGIGMDKAIQIVYRNLLYYITSESEYLQSRRGSIQAAIDLYGENSVEVKTVNEAWDAVGVFDKDYTLPSGRYFIAAFDFDNENNGWFVSSKLTTTSPKRFLAETFNFDFDFIPRDVIWNVTKNSDGTYTFENNGKYMSWTSGNSAEMSLTPMNFNVSFDEKFEGYTISFKASSTNTQILSYNNDNGSRYFAFSGNTNTNHFLMIEDVDDDDIEPIKPPVSIEDDMHKQNNTNKATKCIIDGQLFIIRDGHRYTVTGALVE